MTNDDMIRAFRRELRALERRVERVLAEQSSCCGVTTAQCHAILALEEAGRSSLADLAAALELDSSTLSRTVDGLVKEGLADRREDPTNRRRAILSLSAAGEAAAARINEACDRYYRSLLSSLSEADARGVLRAVPILSEALSAWSASGAGCCAPEERARNPTEASLISGRRA
jgi:DNA-binding MarR family transcriptional regulator